MKELTEKYVKEMLEKDKGDPRKKKHWEVLLDMVIKRDKKRAEKAKKLAEAKK